MKRFVFGQILLVSGLKMLYSHNWPITLSGKITTAHRLFSEHLIQNENKHQIMNMSILSVSVALFAACQFQQP